MMATALNTGMEQLEEEIADLIGKGELQAKIDGKNKLLVAKTVDHRAAVYKRAVDVSEAIGQDIMQCLLLANLRRHALPSDSRQREQQDSGMA